MQEKAERADPHPPGNPQVARTIHIAGSDNDVGDPEVPAIFGQDFVLFHFCEGIGIAPELGMLFNRARFIQQSTLRFLHIAVDGKRTDTDEAPQAPVPECFFEKITRRHDRVEVCIGDGLLASARGQMENDRCVLRCSGAIVARKQIALKDFSADAVGALGAKRLQLRHLA